jgi:hypothetical protein
MFDDGVGVGDGLSVAAVIAAVAGRPPGPEAMGWLASIDGSVLPAGLRVELLVAWEAQAAWVAAEQHRVLAGLDAPDGPPGPADEDWVREEVAAALHLSAVTADRRLQVARGLAYRLPGTWAALAAGQLDVRKATALAEATEPLNAEQAGRVEAAVLSKAPGQTLAELKRAVRRAVLAADPADAETRHQRARVQRWVRLIPAEDGMADLFAHLPAADAVPIMTAVDQIAHTRQPGDTRGVDARRADALTRLVTGEQAGQTRVHVTVAATTLAGADDRPGELTGYGPVTAQVARQLAAGGTWRRLLTDPTGRLLDYGTRTYRPPADLTRHLHARDRVCGFPGCNIPAHRCDLDHTTPYPNGPTNPANMGALCRRHHRAKHQAGWQLTRTPDGTPTWTSPAGKTYRVLPPRYD